MKKLIMSAGMMLALSVPSFADAFEDEANRFLKLSNTVEPSIAMMADLMKLQLPMLSEQLYQQLAAAKKDVTREEVTALMTKFNEKFVDRMAADLVPAVVQSLRAHVTTEELTALNELMAQPAYQSYAAKLPA